MLEIETNAELKILKDSKWWNNLIYDFGIRVTQASAHVIQKIELDEYEYDGE